MLSSPDKWESGLKELQQSSCAVTHLTLHHNQPAHMADVSKALRKNNSITHLEIAELEVTGAPPFAELLSKGSKIKSIRVNAVQVRCAQAAAAPLHQQQLVAAG